MLVTGNAEVLRHLSPLAPLPQLMARTSCSLKHRARPSKEMSATWSPQASVPACTRPCHGRTTCTAVPWEPCEWKHFTTLAGWNSGREAISRRHTKRPRGVLAKQSACHLERHKCASQASEGQASKATCVWIWSTSAHPRRPTHLARYRRGQQLMAAPGTTAQRSTVRAVPAHAIARERYAMARVRLGLRNS